MTDAPPYPAFPLTDREKALMEEIWRSAGERSPAFTSGSDLPIGKTPDPLEDLRAALAALEDLPPPPGHLIALVREEDYGRLLAPLLEVGIRREAIHISEHPDPGFFEVVEIPRLSPSSLFSPFSPGE
ncbi:MAG: hypothetical protein WC277_02110 [Bacilli bacterium]